MKPEGKRAVLKQELNKSEPKRSKVVLQTGFKEVHLEPEEIDESDCANC